MSTASPPAATSNPCPLASEPQHRRNREHPSGFHALCAVELFERFAGTLLGSLVLLYLSERLGMAAGSATRLGGTFNAAIYVSSVIGGVIADRWLGTRRSILLGALLLALGYAVLSMDRATLLYPAAGLLMVGHALFKPSISSAVGKLYPRNDPRRDDAYSLFYVVFNIGSGLARRMFHRADRGRATGLSARYVSCDATFSAVRDRRGDGSVARVARGRSLARRGSRLPLGDVVTRDALRGACSAGACCRRRSGAGLSSDPSCHEGNGPRRQGMNARLSDPDAAIQMSPSRIQLPGT